jgi:hypothetical protein
MKNRACPAQSVPECPMASKVASRPPNKECPAGPSWPNGAEMRAISLGAIVNQTVSEQKDAPGFLREADLVGRTSAHRCSIRGRQARSSDQT